MEDVAREFPSGHIGVTPQDSGAIKTARIQGMLKDFGEYLPPKPRIDAYMALPSVVLAAQPGYFRDQSTTAQIDEAAYLASLGNVPGLPTPKTYGGPNLFGDV